jgi:glycosyltransferase involved in cell wall biosynthesis
MSRKLNILFLIEGNGGGAITHVLTLAKLMDPERFSVSIVFFVDGPSVELANEMGLNSRLIRRRFDLDFTMALGLSRLLKQEKADILHSHTITGNFYARWASRMLRRRPILVTTVHSYVIDEMKGGTEITFRDYLRFKRDVWLSGMTDHFVVVSDGLKKRMLENGAAEEKITLIRNGIPVPNSDETPAAELRAELGIEEHEPVIAAIGRLVPLKNHRLFLKAAGEALKTLPNARFLLIGDGELRDSLERFAQESGISSRVIFTGWRNDLSRFYRLIDILVQCSFTESQGLTILEAMSFAKPVIATDVNEVGKTVRDGETGLLVSPNNEHALAKAIILLVQDGRLAARLGAAGQALVMREFSVETMVAKVGDLYHTLYLEKAQKLHN